MTREEAVNELNDRIKAAEYVNSDYIDCVSVDAVKMAISALSVPDTNVGDMISRQAAIDEIARWIGYIDEDMILRIQTGLKKVPSAQPEPITVNIDHELTQDEYEKLRKDMANAPIMLLPSAQPERKKGKWIYLNELDAFECSVCGRQMVRNIFDYCPWCGAEMTKGEEDE